MAANRFTRSKDYTDDVNNNVGGRDAVDPVGLDGELDEILTVTDDHADKLDTLLRDDLTLRGDIVGAASFSSAALAFLSAFLATATSVLNWRGAWVTAVSYNVGDLVAEAGSAYIALVAHTSGAFSTDLAAYKWDVFVVGSIGLPAFVPDQVLSNDGAVVDWRAITTLEAPTLAPIASPAFTGTVTLPDVDGTGRFNFSVETVAFSAGGNTFNFDTKFMKRVTVTASYTGACSASNITQGDVCEVHFYNSTGAVAALLWDASWVWMGYKPTSLPAGKKAVLTLRAPTGGTAADVIALWSVQP